MNQKNTCKRSQQKRIGNKSRIYINSQTTKIFQTNEFYKALKIMKCNYPEDMVFRKNLTYNEREYIIKKKHIGVELKTSSLPHGTYKVREINNS